MQNKIISITSHQDSPTSKPELYGISQDGSLWNYNFKESSWKFESFGNLLSFSEKTPNEIMKD